MGKLKQFFELQIQFFSDSIFYVSTLSNYPRQKKGFTTFHPIEVKISGGKTARHRIDSVSLTANTVIIMTPQGIQQKTRTTG